MRIGILALILANAGLLFWVEARVNDGAAAALPVRASIGQLAADGNATPPPRADGPVAAEVSIANFDYTPFEVVIAAGQAVRWTHRDGIAAHSVFGDDGLFRSPIGNAGLVFTHTFTAPGRYGYRCSIHGFMTGEVVVSQ